MNFGKIWRGSRRWQIVVLLLLAAGLLLCIWLERQQKELTGSVLRLHVLANSDSEADQELKLKVRDCILAQANEILQDGCSLEQAQLDLSNNLPRLAAAGAEVVAREGYDYSVTAELRQTWFPTKEYENFALPAGQYQALRIVIGDGGGQNWWCVVFPPLCLGSVSESVEDVALEAGLDEQQVALITGESEGYVVKFKVLEIWEKFKNYIS